MKLILLVIIAKSQFEKMTFSKITFREISHPSFPFFVVFLMINNQIKFNFDEKNKGSHDQPRHLERHFIGCLVLV